jgi:endonuclease/exonuclease/phosphatase family metal-dependent hydrolase
MATRAPLLALVAAAAALSGCAHATNYTGVGPRFAGSHRVADTDPRFLVASFNVKFSRHPDRVVALFREHEPLRNADVVALQEMKEDGVERIARELGYDYVYYPSALHPSADGNFGNAVLSRWPIVSDRKLVLPHRSRWRKLQRAACIAEIAVGDRRLRVVSVHLETPFGIGRRQRHEQARAIVEDAAASRYPVVVAGDFNSRWIATDFQRAGFRWATREVGGSFRWYQWDHVFVRGLPVPARPLSGIVRDTRGASDHRPVWAELELSDVSGPAASP